MLKDLLEEKWINQASPEYLLFFSALFPEESNLKNVLLVAANYFEIISQLPAKHDEKCNATGSSSIFSGKQSLEKFIKNE